VIVIVLESLRVFAHIALLIFLIQAGRERLSAPSVGWKWVIVGFSLMTFGSLVDFTDNFNFFSRFAILGNTPAQAFLENFVGYLVGFITLAIGLVIWVPKEF